MSRGGCSKHRGMAEKKFKLIQLTETMQQSLMAWFFTKHNRKFGSVWWLWLFKECWGNSNPAQYKRNSKFRHLVCVLGWEANVEKLPIMQLWLNTSKSDSHLNITILQYHESSVDLTWPGNPAGAHGKQGHSQTAQGVAELVLHPLQLFTANLCCTWC